MRYRSIGMCIVLTLITCGIYGLYWLVCLNDDVAEYTGEYVTSGGMVLLLSIVTCGIYSIYWAYKMGEALDYVRVADGRPSGSLGILYLILSILGLGIVTYALIQSELNRGAGSGYGV